MVLSPYVPPDPQKGASMPLLIDDIEAAVTQADTQAIAVAVNPLFFDKRFTGNGRHKRGMLQPGFGTLASTNSSSQRLRALDDIELKNSTSQNGVTTTSIPFAPVLRRVFDVQNATISIPMPPIDERFIVDAGIPDVDVYFFLTPQGARLFEDAYGTVDAQTGRAKAVKNPLFQFRMELIFVGTGLASNEPARVGVVPGGDVYDHHLRSAHRAAMTSAITMNSISPAEDAADWIAKRLSALGGTFGNAFALPDWFNDEYSLYDQLQKLAETWSSEVIAEHVVALIDDLLPVVHPDALKASTTGMTSTQDLMSSNDALSKLKLQLMYLENYNVSLEAYRIIHRKIEAVFTDEIAGALSKQNLNLLMSHTLAHLESQKANLQVAPQPTPAPNLPSFLSTQQRAAITTDEPLALVVAGAGTGKTSVISQRIAYLNQCGVRIEDITVLSFTNAAADTVRDRNPGIGSMTIAKMINDIYRENYPDHELSSMETLINSLQIFFKNDDFAVKFASLMEKASKNDTGAFTKLNTFIENNFSRVIDALNAVKQTTLELEIIIAYQQIDTMREPAHVQCRYLIVDEVQDTSIFEFVYLLKYVVKHQLALFMVGDASQTLYEFRNANPRALNTLEGSGVFAVFKLSTNFRSTQEILDFANVVLGNLKTNQLSQIQLQANSLAVPSATSFQNSVTVDHRFVAKKADFIPNQMPDIIKSTVSRFVDEALAKGEQVCFLAYSRRATGAMLQALTEHYPNIHVATLVSERPMVGDIFSKFIKNYWNDVMQVPPKNAAFTAVQSIRDNLPSLLPRNQAADPKVRSGIDKMISSWWQQSSSAVSAWVNEEHYKLISRAQFFERLRDNMLGFEIRNNAVRQSMTTQNNRERKEKNAASGNQLVVSTIHGAKGMEFDNVVILHDARPEMEEAAKREYYVAFTRARKREYVLSFGTDKDPAIVSEYNAIIEHLTRQDARAAAVAAGIDPDSLEDAELTAIGTAAAANSASDAGADTTEDADSLVVV